MDEKQKQALKVLMSSDNALKKKAIAFLVKQPESLEILKRALEYQDEPQIKLLIQKAISYLGESEPPPLDKLSEEYHAADEEEKIEILKKIIKSCQGQTGLTEFLTMQLESETERIKYFILRSLVVILREDALSFFWPELISSDSEYCDALQAILSKFDVKQLIKSAYAACSGEDPKAACGAVKYSCIFEENIREKLIKKALDNEYDDARIMVFDFLKEFSETNEEIKGILDAVFNESSDASGIQHDDAPKADQNDTPADSSENTEIESSAEKTENNTDNGQILSAAELKNIITAIRDKSESESSGLLSFRKKKTVNEEEKKLQNEILEFDDNINRIFHTIGKTIYLEYVGNISRSSDVDVVSKVRMAVTVDTQLKEYRTRFDDLKGKAGGGLMKLFQKNNSSLNIYEQKVSYLTKELDRHFIGIGELILQKIDMNPDIPEREVYKKDYEKYKEYSIMLEKAARALKNFES